MNRVNIRGKAGQRQLTPCLRPPRSLRFISAERLLCRVDLTLRGDRIPDGDEDWRYNVLSGEEWAGPADDPEQSQHLDWVIVGGESGPGARRFDIAWARSILAQFQATGVACFVKQLGAKPKQPQGCGDCDPCLAGQRCGQSYNIGMTLESRKGGDPQEWPEELRVREYPAVRP